MGLMDPQPPLPLKDQVSGGASVSWGAGDIAWALLALLLIVPLLILAGRALISLTPISVNSATLAVSIILELLLIGVAVRFSVIKYHRPWGDLGLRNFAGGRSIGYTILAIMGSVAIVASYTAGLRYFGLEDRIPPTPLFKEHSRLLLAGGVAVASLIAPFAEELFFRGFVFAGLRKTIGPWAAAIFSATLFAVAHLNPFLYPPVFAIGLLFAWVYHRSGSLWYNTLAHIGYNSLVAIVALAQR